MRRFQQVLAGERKDSTAVVVKDVPALLRLKIGIAQGCPKVAVIGRERQTKARSYFEISRKYPVSPSQRAYRAIRYRACSPMSIESL